MHKLLGLLIVGLACTIGFSTVGCSKKKEEPAKQTDEEKAAAKKKADAEAAANKKKMEEEAAAKKKKEDEEAALKKGKSKIAVEDAAATVEQGKKAEVTIKIDRTKFDDPVEVTVSDLPKGVTAKDKTITIEKEKTEGKITLEAAKDADEKGGEATITAKGGDLMATGKLKVTVKK